MPVRPVLTYPDPMLKSVAAACAGVDDEVREVARDLLETMRAHGRCVGLSAPQIGVPRRVIAVDVTGHPKATACHGTLVIVNPEIVAAEGSEIGREGCLSLPSITADRCAKTRNASLTMQKKSRSRSCSSNSSGWVLFMMPFIFRV